MCAGPQGPNNSQPIFAPHFIPDATSYEVKDPKTIALSKLQNLGIWASEPPRISRDGFLRAKTNLAVKVSFLY